jgi:nucleoside-diphosphate-sugar epimerase
MSAVFVTGGSGFIGGRLIERLRGEGREVHALARSPQAAKRVRSLGAEPVQGDLADVGAMRAAAEGCDVAFHAAATLGDSGRREDFIEGNVRGTRNALTACAAAGVGRFVHVGTEAVLLSSKPLVQVDETAPLQTESPAHYVATKALAERSVISANREGFETIVVRPRFVWGSGDTTLLPLMSEMVRSGRFAWIGGGRHLTSTTHVANVVEGLICGAERGRPGQAYFVTDGDPVVFRDFVTELLATQGVEAPTRSIPDPLAHALASPGETAWRFLPLPGQPPITLLAYWLSSQECTIRIDKARTQLGYSPPVSIPDGMAELAAA